MKKLLIALAAGAAAIGAYATPAIGGAGFDKVDASPLTWTEAGGFASGYWTVPEGSTATWTAGTVSSYSLSNGHPEGYNDDGKTDGCGYMAIKTSGAPIYQNVKESGTQKIGGGFYFDGLVQFTTFDEMPTIADDAKIAIFPMNDDPENEEAGASYYVYARGTDGKGYAWKTTTAADDNWHRVTVKMIANVSTTKEANDVGFVVFIDETALNCLDAKAVFASTTLSPAVDKWYQYGQLFGSLKGTDENGFITGVAYEGQGKIDEVGFTDAAPWADAADDQFFTVTWGETIAKVEINGVEYTKPIIMDGTVETYTYQAFAKDGYVSMTEAVAFDPQPTNGDDMLIPALAAAGAYVTIGGEKKAYATIADALAAIKKAPAAAMITFAEDYDASAETLTVENTGFVTTIDLGGMKLTSDITATTDLVITNSVETKTGNIFDGQLIGNLAIGENAAVAIYGGYINGSPETEGEQAIAYGGQFSEKIGSARSAVAVAEGFKLEEVVTDTLWEVVVDTSFTVTVAAAGANSSIASIVVDGVAVQTPAAGSFKAEKSVVVTYVAEEGYFFTEGNAEQTLTEDGAESVAPTAALAVAQIGTTKYASLKTAIEAAKAGDTLTVLADCTNTVTAVFYDTGTNATDQITFVNNYTVTLDTKGNYSIYIVNANVKMTGTGTFFKPSGAASAFVVGSGKDSGQSGRPAKLGYGILDFAGNLTGGDESKQYNKDDKGEPNYKDAPSGMIKVEAGYCNFVGGSVINYRNELKNGKCVSATSTTYTEAQIDHNLTNDLEYVGYVTVQGGTFYANTPILADNKGELKIVGLNNTAKVKPLWDTTVLDYADYCEPGYTFLKVTDEKDEDYGWYKIGMNTFAITVTDGAETPALGTADPASFNVETKFPLAVTLTKPTAPSGKKFKSWSANVGTIVKSTLNIDAFPNEAVVVTVVWEDDAQPLPPEEPIVKPEDKSIDDFVAEVNANKAKYLAAPYGTTTEAYLGLFTAVPNSDGKGVTMELTEAAKEQLETLADTAAATALDGDTLTIAEPVAGFYYSLNEGATLEGMKTLEANANKTVGDGAITFTPDKTGNAGFWKVLVTTKAVTPDVAD